jgi:ArsR family transcriptional regulator, lead/cadmium/zinc/bismuth-responsive transcriptional repressor
MRNRHHAEETAVETAVGANGTCGQHAIHQDRVALVREQMRSEEDFLRLAELFAAMGDPTRVRLIYALAQRELCVCDLAAVLGLSVSAVSHQLRLLRSLRLVKYRREGRLAYYSLDDDHVDTLLRQGLEHVDDRDAHPPASAGAGARASQRGGTS